MATMLGAIEYKRTYFRHRKSGEYAHLVDDRLNVTTLQQSGIELQVELLKSAPPAQDHG